MGHCRASLKARDRPGERYIYDANCGITTQGVIKASALSVMNIAMGHAG